MQFDIPAGDARPHAHARRAQLAARLSRKQVVSNTPDEAKRKESPSSRVPGLPEDIGLVPTPLSTKGRHANPCNPIESDERALAVVSPPKRAYVKPAVPIRRDAAEHHDFLRERDYQSQHEELTNLRSALPDLEKAISLLKAENVRLRTELLVKGRDCEHFKELANQMKAARDREVSSMAIARSEWGKVVSDRDHSVEKLQRDLTDARNSLNELTSILEKERKERARVAWESAEEVAQTRDRVGQLSHALRQQEDALAKKEQSFEQLATKHTQSLSSLQSQISNLTRENEALRIKVVDWEAMSTEVTELQRQISEFKRNRNATETRLRQELGDAAEEIHLLREEKTRLLRIVEKLELQTNAAIAVSENKHSPGAILTPDEEIVSLTSSRTRITKELQSFREGEWSNTLGSIGKLRQHLTEEELLRREAEERAEQERNARRRIEQDIGEKLRNAEKKAEELRLIVSSRDDDIKELHVRQIESRERYSQLKLDAEKDRNELLDTRRRLTEMNEAIASLEQTNNELQKENASLCDQLKTQSEILSRLENDIASYLTAKSTSDDRLRVSEEQRISLQEDFNLLAAEHSTLSVECRHLRGQLDERRVSGQNGVGSFENRGDAEKADSVLSEEAGTEENIELFEKVRKEDVSKLPSIKMKAFAEFSLERNARAQRELDELAGRLSDSETRSAELESTTAALAKEIVRYTTEKESFLGQIHALQSSQAGFDSKIEAAEKALSICQLELERTMETMLSLQSNAKELLFSTEEEVIHSKLKLTEETLRLEAQQKDLKHQLSLRSAEIDTARQELGLKKAVETELESVKSSKSMLERDNLTYLSENERLSELVSSATSIVEQIESALSIIPATQQLTLESRLAQINERCREVFENTKRAEGDYLARIDELKAQNASQKVSLDDSARSLERLRGDLEARCNENARMEEVFTRQLEASSKELEELRKERTQERKKVSEKHDFDMKALQAKVKHSEARRKELELALNGRIDQLQQETKRCEDLEKLLESQTRSLKEKAQRDLEQMRNSYERALVKLRSQIDGADVIDDLRKRLAKAEKELRDIKQVQLHW